MTTATSLQPIRRHWRTRLADKVLIFSLGALGFSPTLFFGTVRAQPAPDSCLDGLPVPTPAAGLHKVVQLVNCSSERLLGTANAAGKFVAGQPLMQTPVFPREKTWVMEPAGSSNHANVLTIDIPKEWEDTAPEGSIGPNFWARTGCRYEVTNGIAQCETGGCSGFYDCSKHLLGPPAGTTLAEWTFYQNVPGTSYYLDHPDISAVNGVNLNLDIQPVGGSTNNPVSPTDPQWLAQNYPLTEHGADLRTPGQKLGQCIPEFQLKRSDLTGFTMPTTPPGQALFAFVIVDSDGIPQDPAGDWTVACFSNCGRYEFPTVPAADCDDSDASCHAWKSFCLNAPSSAYGKSCTTDKDCYYNGIDYGIACWNNGTATTCSGRGFIKNASCDPSVCTFQYGYLGSKAWQPPYGHCTDITSNTSACIGDDTVHQVMRKAYTWPNDPQVYGGDAPLYRIIFAPGGTNVQITPSVGQTPGGSTESGIPLCSSLPPLYGYDTQYSGPGSTKCNKPCDVSVNSLCPGFKPPGATFGVAYPGATTAHPWACNFDPKGGGGNNGVICRWN
jgi:hypothetical protein